MRIDSKELWAQVKENHRRLDNCNFHDFSEDVTPEKKMGKTWKCANCGGTLDSINKLWYERGVKHGKQHEGAGRT